MGYFDEYPLQDYYNYLSNPQTDLMGSMEPIQNQQLGRLLDKADTGAAQMVQQTGQANAQLQQAENAANAEREAQANATMQQAQQAAEQQRQQEAAKKGKLLSLGLMLAGGFGGGGAAGESAATNAGAEAATEAAAEGLADDALGSAVTKSAWDKMGFTNPLFSGSNPALGFILGNPQSGFGMMADNYRKYGRR